MLLHNVPTRILRQFIFSNNKNIFQFLGKKKLKREFLWKKIGLCIHITRNFCNILETSESKKF